GDSIAAMALWERYFPLLCDRARRKLEGVSRRMADEEDVALSAFDSFCRAAKAGRFPDLTDRDSLWYLLLSITARKAIDLSRHEKRQKRGDGKVQGESALMFADSPQDEQVMAQMLGDFPSPEFISIVTEECESLLDSLGDRDLQALAVAKMEGYNNEEIAEQLGCSLRTVERRLALIRKKWGGKLSS
ncbi:MAG: ECF-type sigma factor, partial [Planctomycetales bacterium]